MLQTHYYCHQTKKGGRRNGTVQTHKQLSPPHDIAWRGRGKTVTKTVSLSDIGAAATADTLSALASALGELLEYPVASVRKYDTELLESA